MQTPGLRLVGIGTTPDGRPYFKFITNRKRVVDVIVVLTNDPTTLVYSYQLFDEETETTQRYLGTYGDPMRDRPDPEGPWGAPS
jgi:hypothetical protein